MMRHDGWDLAEGRNVGLVKGRRAGRDGKMRSSGMEMGGNRGEQERVMAMPDMLAIYNDCYLYLRSWMSYGLRRYMHGAAGGCSMIH